MFLVDSAPNVKSAVDMVMSSGLCKKLEGAVFPFQVESLEDGIDDAVHAGHVDETHHGPGSSANLHEAAFDDVGGTHLLPQVPGQGNYPLTPRRTDGILFA